jgi:hypothetical protein
MTRWLFAVVAVFGVAGASHAVVAAEPAERGLSLSAWAGAALDRSVTSMEGRRPVNETAPILGASGLGNIERFAIGGTVDTTPGMFGNARLSLGALVGYQQQVGRTRLHLLAEAGGHRFSEVGGTALGRQLGPDTWLPFAGVRLGAARTVPARGFSEIGFWLFGRHDLGQATATYASDVLGAETRTDYRLGGFMAGLALHVGLRLESPHPWNQGVRE